MWFDTEIKFSFFKPPLLFCVMHLQETVTFSALSVSVLRLNAFFRISEDSAFIFFLFTLSDRGTLFGTGGEADLM